MTSLGWKMGSINVVQHRCLDWSDTHKRMETKNYIISEDTDMTYFMLPMLCWHPHMCAWSNLTKRTIKNCCYGHATVPMSSELNRVPSYLSIFSSHPQAKYYYFTFHKILETTSLWAVISTPLMIYSPCLWKISAGPLLYIIKVIPGIFDDNVKLSGLYQQSVLH